MRLIVVVVLVLGCGGRSIDPVAPITVAPVIMRATPAIRIAPVVTTKTLPYRLGIHSVELLRTMAVRKAPHDAAILGIVSKGTRAGVLDAIDGGDDCRDRWIAIAPRGWVCETFVEPSEAEPSAAIAASFDDEDATPIHSVYGLVRGANATAYASSSDVTSDGGRVLAGSNTVRAVGTATIDGRRF